MQCWVDLMLQQATFIYRHCCGHVVLNMYARSSVTVYRVLKLGTNKCRDNDAKIIPTSRFGLSLAEYAHPNWPDNASTFAMAHDLHAQGQSPFFELPRELCDAIYACYTYEPIGYRYEF